MKRLWPLARRALSHPGRAVRRWIDAVPAHPASFSAKGYLAIPGGKGHWMPSLLVGAVLMGLTGGGVAVAALEKAPGSTVEASTSATTSSYPKPKSAASKAPATKSSPETELTQEVADSSEKRVETIGNERDSLKLTEAAEGLLSGAVGEKEKMDSLGRPEGEGEEEEEECPFCLFMKGGPCRDAFINWEQCVESATKDKADIVTSCIEVTTVLRECMEKSMDYYGAVLEIEKKGEEQEGVPMDQRSEEPTSTSDGAKEVAAAVPG